MIKLFNRMASEEKVTAKIKELNEAVSEAKGCVMVIGLIDTDKKNETCVIASLKGKGEALTAAVAKLLSNDGATEIRNIIENGLAFANIHKIMGGGIANATEAETHESNNL
jgi:hypothetical protein